MSKDVEQEKPVVSSDSVDYDSVQSSVFGLPTATMEFDDVEDEDLAEPIMENIHGLNDQSSIQECAFPYRQELELRGKSAYTITCFLSDLKMFGEFVGHDTPVGRISKENVADWLVKLKFGSRGQTPAPKTMARRITFLKNFFSWLTTEGIIREDPTANVTLERPLPPLPQLLSADEVQRLVDASSTDSRCHCLVYLVLYAGLKKEEVMGLRLHHIDLVDPQNPLVTVHFDDVAGKKHRERRLVLPATFTGIFQKYQAEYHIVDTVFSCTDRNLNYILDRAVRSAKIEKRVTLQLLRDTFAVQQIQSGISFDSLRERLGLSDEAWLESREKYRRLAFPKG